VEKAATGKSPLRTADRSTGRTSGTGGFAQNVERIDRVTKRKQAALKHYASRIEQAQRFINLVVDPQIEEQSAQWMANKHKTPVWMVIEVRKRIGLKGHQRKKCERRPKTTKLLEGWK